MFVVFFSLDGEVSMVNIDGFGWLKFMVFIMLKWDKLYL